MNSFGHNFRVSIFGESHGAQIGVVVDGVPAGLPLDVSDFSADIARRQSGARGTTPRLEADEPLLVSGLYNGHTTGAPIAVLFRNTNTRGGDYSAFTDHPRPGHADFVAGVKYKGFADPRGGGHFSGRLTLPLVSAGVIAKKIITSKGVNITALLKDFDEARLDSAIAARDSVGGIVECRAAGLPVGLGEPFFNSAESLISHIVFAIPGIRGIEFGDGFASAAATGSEHNDMITDTRGSTATNHSGGINGGITNGNELVFRVAVKPTSSISKGQHTYNFKEGKVGELKVAGRHDAAFVLRVPVVVEAAAAIVLADLFLSAQQ